jgi:hypothetical protein
VEWNILFRWLTVIPRKSLALLCFIVLLLIPISLLVTYNMDQVYLEVIYLSDVQTLKSLSLSTQEFPRFNRNLSKLHHFDANKSHVLRDRSRLLPIVRRLTASTSRSIYPRIAVTSSTQAFGNCFRIKTRLCERSIPHKSHRGT